MLELDLLPVDVDAERALLGAILAEPDAFGRISASIDARDFSLEQHRRIFGAMGDVYSAGSVTDLVTVAGRLNDTKRIESIGGLSYLAGLDNAIGQIFGTDDYCKRVKEKSILRRAILSMTKAITEMQQNGDSREVLEQAERTIRQLSSETSRDLRLRTAGEIIAAHGGMDSFMRDTAASVRTPWARLNRVLGGGFRDEELIILGARPSVGKTAAALQFAEAAAGDGVVAPVFSLEMGAKPLLHRMACSRSRVDSNAMRTGNLRPDQRMAFMRAMSEIDAMPLYFDDTTSCTVSAIHAAIRRLNAVRPVGFVVIDYLQLMEAPGRHENRNQSVSAVSRGLKLAAMDLGIPFLVLSQLNRPEKEGGTVTTRAPILQDLRESGSIEQDADIVLFLHRKKQDYGDIRAVDLIVAKQRNGPLDTIPMNFYSSYTRLEEQIDEPRTMHATA